MISSGPARRNISIKVNDVGGSGKIHHDVPLTEAPAITLFLQDAEQGHSRLLATLKNGQAAAIKPDIATTAMAG